MQHQMGTSKPEQQRVWKGPNKPLYSNQMGTSKPEQQSLGGPKLIQISSQSIGHLAPYVIAGDKLGPIKNISYIFIINFCYSLYSKLPGKKFLFIFISKYQCILESISYWFQYMLLSKQKQLATASVLINHFYVSMSIYSCGT